MPEWWQVGVAFYAAIVATGALFLEVRRWVEGRVRLILTANSGMQTFNVRGTEGNVYLWVTTVNRGASPTTLTHLALMERPNWWGRLRGLKVRTGIVVNPSLPGTDSGRLPYVLVPGGLWMGGVREDDELRDWINTGRLEVVVYGSHSDRPARKRVKPKTDEPKALEGAEER